MLMFNHRHIVRFVARLSTWLLACMISVSAMSCAGIGGGQSPESTVRSFSRALRDGRASDAYALMSQSYRARVSLADFEAYLNDFPDESRQTARALSRRRGPARQEASLTFGDGDELRLVRDGRTWAIATDVVNYYDRSSPRAALRSLIRAMERRRYDVVLTLIPRAEREGMSESSLRDVAEGEGREELERLIAALRAAIDNPIEEVGNRATMPYGERFRVVFLREDGLWKISDPD